MVYTGNCYPAYNRHQWACQLWYHPRKDALWGQMEKGVKGSGASYTTLFLDYMLWVTTVIYLCLTCKSSISLQRNTSSYQGGSRNIFNMQRVSSTLQPKSLAHNL